MKRKTMILLLAMVFVLNICTFGIMAEDIPVSSGQGLISCPYPELLEVTSLAEGENLIINNTSNPLFWEFSDYDDAFYKISEHSKNLLSVIAVEGDLANLNVNNWKDYQAEFLKINAYDNYNQEDESVKILHQFFIICENHEINKIAKQIYNQRNYNLVELSSFLPYTSPIINELKNSIISKSVPATRGFTEGINYAKKYATNPNKGSYKYYEGNDCANFVSQILKASGVVGDNDWRPYTSKWINAHSFTLYWYMKSSANNGYPSFSSVSAAAKVGNVISVDYHKDGRYDHVAYVVATGGKTSQGYYDITIAQHSSNYCDKVSSSANKWENTSGLYVRLPI